MTVATSFTLNAAVLMVYDTIGIDFGTTAPADPDTTFNQFSGSGIAGGFYQRAPFLRHQNAV